MNNSNNLFKNNKKLIFVDLFSGIGAFHEAIMNIFPQAHCKFALDIDKEKNKVYQLLHNFPKENMLEGDIGDEEIVKKLISNGKIDLLCAGFPCQPYSRAGKQTTYQHVSYDTFSKLLNVISLYNQKYQGEELKIIVLENVNSLTTVEEGQIWKKMKEQIKDLGYIFSDEYQYVKSSERERERDKKWTYSQSSRFKHSTKSTTIIPFCFSL